MLTNTSLPSAVSLPAPRQSGANTLPVRVLERLRQCFDASCALDFLISATGAEFYVFGGTVRRVLFHDTFLSDLDIMVPNGDCRAFEGLDYLKVPHELNRKGHRRYCWNTLRIELLQPKEFYTGFPDIKSALHFFDLKIDALALHVSSGKILDPFDVLSQDTLVDPGINWSRWNKMSPLELSVLAIRLVRILHETPTLKVASCDADRLMEGIVPKILECDWTKINWKFPLGKDAFLQLFRDKVQRRSLSEVP